jgi:hypothetical protein
VFQAAISSLAIAMLMSGPPVQAAESVGVVTILEGDASLVRGLSKFALAEGVRVQGDDLVETGKATFLRIEFSDGVIVDLGPGTRAQLNRPSTRKYDRPTFYLLAGWAKIGAGKLGAGTKAAVAAPQFDAIGLSGETVERVDSASAALFAEEGAVRVVDHRRGAGVVQLKSGEFLSVRKDEAPRVEGRPTHEFVAALPRQFEDPLPSRADRFREREVPAKPLGAFTYAEVEPWLDAEAMVRRRFPHDWAAKAAADETFRERLESGLARHPEWERVLYPERFEPKPPPVASVPQGPDTGGSATPNPSVPSAAPNPGTEAGVPGH